MQPSLSFVGPTATLKNFMASLFVLSFLSCLYTVIAPLYVLFVYCDFKKERNIKKGYVLNFPLIMTIIMIPCLIFDIVAGMGYVISFSVISVFGIVMAITFKILAGYQLYVLRKMQNDPETDGLAQSTMPLEPKV